MPGNEQPQLVRRSVRRLNPCRVTSLRDEALLQYLPVICVTATSDHAILLERFAHAHMTAFEPAMCLDLASDADRSMDREKYHRHAANMLIKLRGLVRRPSHSFPPDVRPCETRSVNRRSCFAKKISTTLWISKRPAGCQILRSGLLFTNRYVFIMCALYSKRLETNSGQLAVVIVVVWW